MEILSTILNICILFIIFLLTRLFLYYLDKIIENKKDEIKLETDSLGVLDDIKSDYIGGDVEKLIFLSHPYSENPDENLERIDNIVKTLNKNYKNYLFISPLHAFSYFDEESDNLRSSILYVCLGLIDICDEVWCLGGTRGCSIEVCYGLEIDKRVGIYDLYDVKYIDDYRKEKYKFVENGGEIYFYDYGIIEGEIDNESNRKES